MNKCPELFVSKCALFTSAIWTATNYEQSLQNLVDCIIFFGIMDLYVPIYKFYWYFDIYTDTEDRINENSVFFSVFQFETCTALSKPPCGH